MTAQRRSRGAARSTLARSRSCVADPRRWVIAGGAGKTVKKAAKKAKSKAT